MCDSVEKNWIIKSPSGVLDVLTAVTTTKDKDFYRVACIPTPGFKAARTGSRQIGLV